MLQRYTQLINFIKDNDQMLLMIIAFVATMLVVYCIRRLSVDHSWEIAIITAGRVGDYAIRSIACGTYLLLSRSQYPQSAILALPASVWRIALI